MNYLHQNNICMCSILEINIRTATYKKMWDLKWTVIGKQTDISVDKLKISKNQRKWYYPPKKDI